MWTRRSVRLRSKLASKQQSPQQHGHWWVVLTVLGVMILFFYSQLPANQDSFASGQRATTEAFAIPTGLLNEDGPVMNVLSIRYIPVEEGGLTREVNGDQVDLPENEIRVNLHQGDQTFADPGGIDQGVDFNEGGTPFNLGVSFAEAQERIDDLTTGLQANLEEGSRYRGYQYPVADRPPPFIVFDKVLPVTKPTSFPVVLGNQLGRVLNDVYGGSIGDDQVEGLVGQDICAFVDSDEQAIRQVWLWGDRPLDETMGVNKWAVMSMGSNLGDDFYNYETYGDVSWGEPGLRFGLPQCENTYTVFYFNYNQASEEAAEQALMQQVRQVETVLKWLGDEWTPATRRYDQASSGKIIMLEHEFDSFYIWHPHLFAAGERMGGAIGSVNETNLFWQFYVGDTNYQLVDSSTGIFGSGAGTLDYLQFYNERPMVRQIGNYQLIRGGCGIGSSAPNDTALFQDQLTNLDFYSEYAPLNQVERWVRCERWEPIRLLDQSLVVDENGGEVVVTEVGDPTVDTFFLIAREMLIDQYVLADEDLDQVRNQDDTVSGGYLVDGTNYATVRDYYEENFEWIFPEEQVNAQSVSSSMPFEDEKEQLKFSLLIPVVEHILRGVSGDDVPEPIQDLGIDSFQVSAETALQWISHYYGARLQPEALEYYPNLPVNARVANSLEAEDILISEAGQEFLSDGVTPLLVTLRNVPSIAADVSWTPIDCYNWYGTEFEGERTCLELFQGYENASGTKVTAQRTIPYLIWSLQNLPGYDHELVYHRDQSTQQQLSECEAGSVCERTIRADSLANWWEPFWNFDSFMRYDIFTDGMGLTRDTLFDESITPNRPNSGGGNAQTEADLSEENTVIACAGNDATVQLCLGDARACNGVPNHQVFVENALGTQSVEHGGGFSVPDEDDFFSFWVENTSGVSVPFRLGGQSSEEQDGREVVGLTSAELCAPAQGNIGGAFGGIVPDAQLSSTPIDEFLITPSFASSSIIDSSSLSIAAKVLNFVVPERCMQLDVTNGDGVVINLHEGIDGEVLDSATVDSPILCFPLDEGKDFFLTARPEQEAGNGAGADYLALRGEGLVPTEGVAGYFELDRALVVQTNTVLPGSLAFEVGPAFSNIDFDISVNTTSDILTSFIARSDRLGDTIEFSNSEVEALQPVLVLSTQTGDDVESVLAVVPLESAGTLTGPDAELLFTIDNIPVDDTGINLVASIAIPPVEAGGEISCLSFTENVANATTQAVVNGDVSVGELELSFDAARLDDCPSTALQAVRRGGSGGAFTGGEDLSTSLNQLNEQARQGGQAGSGSNSSSGGGSSSSGGGSSASDSSSGGGNGASSSSGGSAPTGPPGIYNPSIKPGSSEYNPYGFHLLVEPHFVTEGRINEELTLACPAVGEWGFIKWIWYPHGNGQEQVALQAATTVMNAAHAYGMIPVFRLATFWDPHQAPNDVGFTPEVAAAQVQSLLNNRQERVPVIIEAFNEPNLRWEWSGKQSTAGEYANWMVDFYKAITALYPNHVEEELLYIGTAGLSPNAAQHEQATDDAGLTEYVSAMYAANAEIAFAWDLWGVQGKAGENHRITFDHLASLAGDLSQGGGDGLRPTGQDPYMFLFEAGHPTIDDVMGKTALWDDDPEVFGFVLWQLRDEDYGNNRFPGESFLQDNPEVIFQIQQRLADEGNNRLNRRCGDFQEALSLASDSEARYQPAFRAAQEAAPIRVPGNNSAGDGQTSLIGQSGDSGDVLGEVNGVDFRMPVRPATVTQGFRPGHQAVDWSNAPSSEYCGEPIFAAANGTVSQLVTSNTREDGGPSLAFASANNFIYIDHANGAQSRYLHIEGASETSFSYDRVAVGTEVRQGQQIATVGDTGFSTNCHLHFEILNNGVFVDPLAIVEDRPREPASSSNSDDSNNPNADNSSTSDSFPHEVQRREALDEPEAVVPSSSRLYNGLENLTGETITRVIVVESRIRTEPTDEFVYILGYRVAGESDYQPAWYFYNRSNSDTGFVQRKNTFGEGGDFGDRESVGRISPESIGIESPEDSGTPSTSSPSGSNSSSQPSNSEREEVSRTEIENNQRLRVENNYTAVARVFFDQFLGDAQGIANGDSLLLNVTGNQYQTLNIDVLNRFEEGNRVWNRYQINIGDINHHIIIESETPDSPFGTIRVFDNSRNINSSGEIFDPIDDIDSISLWNIFSIPQAFAASAIEEDEIQLKNSIVFIGDESGQQLAYPDRNNQFFLELAAGTYPLEVRGPHKTLRDYITAERDGWYKGSFITQNGSSEERGGELEFDRVYLYPRTGTSQNGEIFFQPPDEGYTVYEFRIAQSSFEEMSFQYQYQTEDGGGADLDFEVLVDDGTNVFVAYDPGILQDGTDWRGSNAFYGSSELGFTNVSRPDLSSFQGQDLSIRFVTRLAPGASASDGDALANAMEIRRITFHSTTLDTTIRFDGKNNSQVIDMWDSRYVNFYISDDPFVAGLGAHDRPVQWMDTNFGQVDSNGEIQEGRIDALSNVEICDRRLSEAMAIYPSTTQRPTYVDYDFTEGAGSALDRIFFDAGGDCINAPVDRTVLNVFALVLDEYGTIDPTRTEVLYEKRSMANIESKVIDLSHLKGERVVLRFQATANPVYDQVYPGYFSNISFEHGESTGLVGTFIPVLAITMMIVVMLIFFIAIMGTWWWFWQMQVK